MKLKNSLPLTFFSLLVLLIPVVWLILSPGFFSTDDGNWMVIRLASFYDTLRQGQFPVRFLFSLNHGYGYPVTNFLYPLPFYLGSIIHKLSFNFVDSIKILFALSFTIGAIGTFLLVKKRSQDNFLALLCALFYSYFPYHVFDIFVRGSIGEATALGFAPYLFLGIEKIRKNEKLGTLVVAISLAFLVASHNSLGLMFVGVACLEAATNFFFRRDIKTLISTIWGIIFGIGLCGFFWLPAIFELSYTKSSSISVSHPFDYFLNDINFNLILGLPSIVIFIVTLFLFLKMKVHQKPQNLFWPLIFIASIFLTLPVSQTLWNMKILITIVQFPWRFLSLAILSGAMSLGQLKNTSLKAKVLISFLMALMIIWSFSNTIDLKKTFYPDSYYSTNDDTTTVKNEYMPKWVKVDPITRPTGLTTILGNNKTQINVVYFPGISIYENGVRKNYTFDSGFPVVLSNHSTAHYEVKFEETPLRKIANLISIISMLILILYSVYHRKHENN